MRTRLFKMLTLLTVALMLLPAVAGAQVQKVPAGLSDEAAREEPDAQQALDDLDVSVAPQTGKVRFLRLTPEQSEVVARQLGAQGTVEEKAAAFLEEYGALFGVRDAGAELKLAKTQVDQLGYTHLSYDQVYQGVPVFAGVLRVHFDDAGQITAVNGLFIPDVAVNITPALSPEEAIQIAEEAVNGFDVARELERGTIADRARAVETTLYVFRENLARGLPGANHLAYEVEVSNGRDVREFVYVDAHSGKVVDQITGIYEALDRNVYNQIYDPSVLVWQEGDPLPFTGSPEITRTELISDVNNVLNYTEDTYNMVAAASGGTFLSYDGADAPMDLVVDSALIACPNAMWNGVFTQFCEQVTGDDTVAHEWGHAYTDYTHDLIYAWQPGAINESYSDIYGEVVDLINGEGLDEPGGLRSDGACSIYTSWPPKLTVTAPPSIAGDYAAGAAQFGPAVDGTLTGPLMIVDDGSAAPTEGCNPLVNDLTGKIAFIRRGTCNFTVKVKNAQNAGAIGAVIANHEAGGDGTINMSGDDPTITIQSLSIGYSNGNLIEAEIPGGVDVEFNLDTLGAEPDDSYRWLSGEDDPAFGGAIRDMWMPSCYGDPDNVTSDDYMCGTDDQGGVHTNSGVPNHAFALLVDGGTFNAVTVGGIGLTKAFHIYWRAQSHYQVPASDFADHADALEWSCADLVAAGTDLPDLTTGLPSGQVMSSADCDSVADAILAVELRSAPLCEWEPLLDPDTPALCVGDTGPDVSIYSNDFETVTNTWTVDNYGVYAEYDPVDWVWTTIPASHYPRADADHAFLGEDPLSFGDCTPGSDDQSGVKYLYSPEIVIPMAATHPRVAFNHYVATEAGYDGGNISLSVNGGDWMLLPAEDFTFNGYNTSLISAGGGNSNPLAGQPAYTGTDEGSVGGSWGQTHVNLGHYAQPGDTVRLRFALGVDGCNGIEGWYVDDVSVYYCENQTAPEIMVDDTGLSVSQVANARTDQSLAVTNVGIGDLHWSIAEEPSERSAPARILGSNLVADPSFEAGTPNPYWGEYSYLPAYSYDLGTPLCDPASCGYDLAYDGIWYVWFGGWGTENIAVVSQTITIPASGDADLSFMLAAFPSGPDVMNVTIDDTVVFTVNQSNAAAYDDWTEVVLNFDAYADGGDHVVAFEADTVANIFLDLVSLKVPDCLAPSDVSWLSVDPTAGTTARWVSTPVTVTFDSTGLDVGLYEGNLCITSDDPVEPLAVVPVSLEVLHGVYLPLVLRN